MWVAQMLLHVLLEARFCTEVCLGAAPHGAYGVVTIRAAVVLLLLQPLLCNTAVSRCLQVRWMTKAARMPVPFVHR
jgi:hypothetical protein